MTVAATVVFVRPPGAARDRDQAYQVLIDAADRGTVRAGDELRLVVAPGGHRARVRLGRAGSRELKFEVGAGREVRLRVEPNGGPLAALWRLVAKDRYLRLTREG
ncbi:hypothetical protein ACFFWC_03820 [Plantactinospora siamensis]|uniref:Uncharacterized protein n=1 Tax=Plantactinospora siamensis TaxID=555372 RepID=A0ABV6NQU0_9ACTN